MYSIEQQHQLKTYYPTSHPSPIYLCTILLAAMMAPVRRKSTAAASRMPTGHVGASSITVAVAPKVASSPSHSRTVLYERGPHSAAGADSTMNPRPDSVAFVCLRQSTISSQLHLQTKSTIFLWRPNCTRKDNNDFKVLEVMQHIAYKVCHVFSSRRSTVKPSSHFGPRTEWPSTMMNAWLHKPRRLRYR